MSELDVGSIDTSGLETLDMSKMKYDLNTSNSLKKIDGIKVKVSGVFHHRQVPKEYTCVFIDAPKELYFLTGEFLRITFDHLIEHVMAPKGLPIPMYMSTLGDLSICLQSDHHNYKRTKKGWTINKIQMILEFPTNMASVKKFATSAIETLALNYKEDSDCGAIFATWLK